MLSTTVTQVIAILIPICLAVPAVTTSAVYTPTIFSQPTPTSDSYNVAATPQYTAIVSAAPDQDEVLARQGYYQTTYYACRTMGNGEERCGWHIPILRLESEAARNWYGKGWMLGVVGILALVMA